MESLSSPCWPATVASCSFPLVCCQLELVTENISGLLKVSVFHTTSVVVIFFVFVLFCAAEKLDIQQRRRFKQRLTHRTAHSQEWRAGLLLLQNKTKECHNQSAAVCFWLWHAEFILFQPCVTWPRADRGLFSDLSLHLKYLLQYYCSPRNEYFWGINAELSGICLCLQLKDERFRFPKYPLALFGDSERKLAQQRGAKKPRLWKDNKSSSVDVVQ